MWNEPRTIYVGIDYSLTSPGICCHVARESGSAITRFGYFGRRKIEALGPDFSWLGDPGAHKTEDPFTRYEFLRDSTLRFIDCQDFNSWHPVRIAAEGFSYGSTGMTFEIGENMGVLISGLRKRYKGHRFMKIPPTVVKKEATGKGNAKKEDMIEAFKKETGVDLLALTGAKKPGSPDSDIADSYFVMKTGMKLFTSVLS